MFAPRKRQGRELLVSNPKWHRPGDLHGTAAVRQVGERAKEIGKGWEIQQVSFDEDFNRTGSKRKPCTEALALLVRCQLLPKQLSNCSYREPKDITKQNYPRRN